MVCMTTSASGANTAFVLMASLAVALSFLPEEDTKGPLADGRSAPLSADVQRSRGVQQSEKNPPVLRKVKIVIEGDSLSVRGGKNVFTWSDQLYEKFGKQYEFAFHATAGDQLGRQIKTQISQVTEEFDSSSSNLVILYAGVNDLYVGVKGHKVYEAALHVAGAYRRSGFRVWIATVPPARGIDDAEREKYNTLLKTAESPPWERVIDFAAIPEFTGPAPEVTRNGKIYAPDQIHLSKNGHKLLFLKVSEALKTLTTGTG